MNEIPDFTYDPSSSLATSDNNSGEVLATDQPTTISGSSIFPESTRIVSAPAIPDLPYDAIFNPTKPLPHVEPWPTPAPGAGSPAAASPRSAGLGSSAYSSGLEGWDK
jgi:hypothetical protein